LDKREKLGQELTEIHQGLLVSDPDSKLNFIKMIPGKDHQFFLNGKVLGSGAFGKGFLSSNFYFNGFSLNHPKKKTVMMGERFSESHQELVAIKILKKVSISFKLNSNQKLSFSNWKNIQKQKEALRQALQIKRDLIEREVEVMEKCSSLENPNIIQFYEMIVCFFLFLSFSFFISFQKIDQNENKTKQTRKLEEKYIMWWNIVQKVLEIW